MHYTIRPQNPELPLVMSVIAHDNLKMLPIKRTIPCRVCSQCKLHSNAAQDKAHPLEKEMYEVSDLLDQHPDDAKLASRYHKLVSQIHWTSRCCGARMENVEVDYHAALWESWKARERDFMLLAGGASREDFIYELRDKMGRNGMGADNDFIMMNVLWGMDDQRTNRLISIFRQEEARQEEERIKKGMAAVASISDVMCLANSNTIGRRSFS